MIDSVTGMKNDNLKILGVGFVLLLSFLMMRVIVIMYDLLNYGYPPFRIMMGLAIVFVLIIPILAIFLSAKLMTPRTSFLLPYLISGICFPVCDSLFLDTSLLQHLSYFLPFLIGGLGYGFIGLSGNYYHIDFKKSIIIFTAGMGIILLNSVNYIPITYYVLTGDTSVLSLIPSL